ncbi:MAG: restriction endonuclease subunit S [Sphingobacteriales bacterium]|nr:MAG: restriction endonuclease subunit S [Sphingobacteriales bacterium]
MSWSSLENAFTLIRNGASIKQDDNKLGIPITRIETISNRSLDKGKLGYANVLKNQYTDFYLKNGDILMSHINSLSHLGKTALVESLEEEIIHGMNLLLLRANTKILHPNYANYYFSSPQFIKDLMKISNQSVNQCSFSISKLKDLQIPLPPLPVQKRIAEILDAADALKRKDQELLKKYDELAQAIFIDMFGDPVKNEKGWEVRTIGSLTSVGSGSTPSRQVNEYFGGPISWVKTTEVNGQIIYSTEENISEKGLKNSSCKLYPKNSVIIAMYGQGKTRGQVGILGVEATTNQACAVIKPSKELDSTFLFNYLKLSYKTLRELGRGGNQENLNKGMIEDFEIIFPDYTKQLEFNKRMEILDSLKKSFNQNKSQNLFNSLIKKAFKGKLAL